MFRHYRVCQLLRGEHHMKDGKLSEALRKWSNTPSVNPRYKGATPADVARALLGKKPEGEVREEAPEYRRREEDDR